MSPRKPPALASWLLDRFGYARRNPALIGDLLEEFQSGRSPAWYWRQSLAVIVKTPGRKDFAGLAAKALLAGYAAQVAVVYDLWRFHTMPHVQGFFGWTLALALAVFAPTFAGILVVVAAAGRRGFELRSLLWIHGNQPAVRRVATVHLFARVFVEGSLAYCLAATFRPSDLQPFGGLIGAEIGILGFQVLRLFFWTLVAPIPKQ